MALLCKLWWHIFVYSITILLTRASEKCQPIKISFCDKFYNMTKFPNSLGHAMRDADLQLQTFAPLIQYGCSAWLEKFLCEVYVPQCNTSDPMQTILPSKQLCETVQTTCLPVLHEFGFPWPPALNCTKFPDKAPKSSPQYYPVTLKPTSLEHPRLPSRSIGKYVYSSSTHVCEPITVQMCRDIGYHTTKFPNILGHETQQDAESALEMFTPLMEINCSEHLVDFLCAVYFPKCDSRGQIFSPSRALCKLTVPKCSQPHVYGFVWPKKLNCENFEDATPEPLEFPASTYRLNIKYTPSAITFTSCCHVYSYTQKKFSVNDGVLVKTADMRSSNIPKVTWQRNSYKTERRDFKTLLMVSGYTGSKSKPYFFINWMITNIPYGETSSGVTVKEYEGPLPVPKGDNKVYFLLFNHSKPLTISTVGKYNNPRNSRFKMDFVALTKENNMTLMSSKYILIHEDEYSRFQVLQKSDQSEADVCKGVPGYPTLCKQQLDSMPHLMSRK